MTNSFPHSFPENQAEADNKAELTLPSTISKARINAVDRIQNGENVGDGEFQPLLAPFII